LYRVDHIIVLDKNLHLCYIFGMGLKDNFDEEFVKRMVAEYEKNEPEAIASAMKGVAVGSVLNFILWVGAGAIVGNMALGDIGIDFVNYLRSMPADAIATPDMLDGKVGLEPLGDFWRYLIKTITTCLGIRAGAEVASRTKNVAGISCGLVGYGSGKLKAKRQKQIDMAFGKTAPKEQ